MSSTTSSTASTTTSAAASASSSAAATLTLPSSLKTVGIVLAIASGCLIGSSFVFKKKGLLSSQKGHAAGEGVAYLKSPLWWTGMIMMILGELCNFAAYAFVEALVVTPLGALSVVICAILSSIFLKETLSFFGWVGCALCIIGSIIIALNGPQEQTVSQITEFQALFLAPGFLAYGSVLIAVSLSIMFYFGPKYGTKSMFWYIFVCSMIGGISVSVTTGLGSAIVTTAMGNNQFDHWFIYFLIIFVAVTLVTEVFYLNKALALFNTAMVTPTYYVIFTFFSMVTTVILFQGLKASAGQILTIVMAFLVICCGITILQMSKIDPTQFKTLDRKSTMLLQAARQNTEKVENDDLSGIEDPGIDAIRGTFGGLGSLIRARSARKLSMSTGRSGSMSTVRARTGHGSEISAGGEFRDGLQRHQLYDAPMPSMPSLYGGSDGGSLRSPTKTSANAQPPRTPTIKFDSQEIVHTYNPTKAGAAAATHEQRNAWGSHHFASPPTSPRFGLSGLPPVEEGAEMRPLHSILTPAQRPSVAIGPPVEVSDPFARSSNPFSPVDNPFSPVSDPYDRTSSIMTTRGGTSHLRQDPMLPEEDDDDLSARGGRRERGHGHARRSSGRHNYPTNASDDDREESMSLVHPPRSSLDVDGETDDTDDDDLLRRGGIRLVGPTPR